MLYATIKFYAIEDSIAFQGPFDAEPFLIIHKTKIRAKRNNINGILFEYTDSENDIAYVNSFLDVKDESNLSYGASLYAVLNALALVLKLNVTSAIDLTNFGSIPGNSLVVTYYTGTGGGANPSGSTSNIEKIEYFTGATLMFTKTLSYNAADLIILVVIS